MLEISHVSSSIYSAKVKEGLGNNLSSKTLYFCFKTSSNIQNWSRNKCLKKSNIDQVTWNAAHARDSYLPGSGTRLASWQHVSCHLIGQYFQWPWTVAWQLCCWQNGCCKLHTATFSTQKFKIHWILPLLAWKIIKTKNLNTCSTLWDVLQSG